MTTNLKLEDFDRMPDSAFVPEQMFADLLGVSRDTVKRRSKDGSLPAAQEVCGMKRYQVGIIRRHLASFASAGFSLDTPDRGFDQGLHADGRQPEVGHGQ